MGLTLYLGLLIFCLLTLRRLRRLARGNTSLDWIVNYSHMLEAGLFGFMVSGAFLGRAYFDLYFLLVAATVILKILYIREAALPAPERESLTHAPVNESMIPVGVA